MWKRLREWFDCTIRGRHYVSTWEESTFPDLVTEGWCDNCGRKIAEYEDGGYGVIRVMCFDPKVGDYVERRNIRGSK